MYLKDPRQFYYQQREIYSSHLQLLNNEAATLRTAELKTYDQCFELAIEYGIAKGIEQGLELGKFQEKKQIVINMLRHNIAIEIIANCLQLPIATIEAIKVAE